MTDKEKRELESKRKQASLKNMRFNRYLLFRYSLALLFFANLYWFLIQFIQLSFYIAVPIALLVLAIAAIAEQFKLYSAEEIHLEKTRFFFSLQLLIQLLLFFMTLFSEQYTAIFPIFADKAVSRYFVAALLVLGALVSLLNLNRIRQIAGNRDRAYLRYQQVEKTI